MSQQQQQQHGTRDSIYLFISRCDPWASLCHHTLWVEREFLPQICNTFSILEISFRVLLNLFRHCPKVRPHSTYDLREQQNSLALSFLLDHCRHLESAHPRKHIVQIFTFVLIRYQLAVNLLFVPLFWNLIEQYSCIWHTLLNAGS